MARVGAKKVQWGGASFPDDRARGPLAASTAERDERQGEDPAGGERRARRAPRPKRIRMTASGPVRLTPTEARIIEFIERHEDKPCSKAQIAAVLGRNEKTVDRLLSRMRREGIVRSTPVYADNGAQLANLYTVLDEGGRRTEPRRMTRPGAWRRHAGRRSECAITRAISNDNEQQ